ncbi:MAG TPA: glycoside hydrolase family 3 C-terminal domain-containing protein, partial [Pyrinomonadaceae bacterium]|nr:glycoside hydrolase family 3 C-terminal domain-containing protein [Pyrinomonadaceae bacterium]
MATIDEAVRHVLRVKFRLGLFDKPFADEDLEKREVFKPTNLDVAKAAAEKSFVLLKNDNQTLPINKSLDEIAVIGSLADNKSEMNSNWAGDGRPEDPITVVEALRQKFPGKKLRYEPGCDPKCETDAGFAKAVEAVKGSDFAILVIGESGAMSGEASSRSNIDLPGRQLDLVKAIHATGKPYVVVLINGRPLTINWLAENSPAILEAWFPGTMAGPAIVDTLFGDANPGGKLPVTFPRSVGQIPIYYNSKRTGRPYKANEKYTSKYLDIPNTPLYPFGYGLSYTRFRMRDLRLDKNEILPTGTIKVSVEVENFGKRVGDEVVQLYVGDQAASVTRPAKELRGFKRITLQPGQKQRVDFTLGPKELQFLGRDLKPKVEPGEFIVYVGNSSEGGLQSSFEVVNSISTRPTPVPISTNEPVDPAPKTPVPTAAVSKEDDEFLGDLQRRTFQFFWEHSDPNTGLTLDRSRTTGEPPPPIETHHKVASIASTGFALSGYCVAAERGWITREQARTRTRNTLDFFANKQEHKNGWFYHFVDQTTGERRWRSELSSIDTALLLGGVLTVRKCFSDDAEIVALADKIYNRVDFQWMLNGDPYLLSHGWRPESGWIPHRWHDYSEDAILYLLAIGSPTKPIPPQSWYAWERNWQEYAGYRYIGAVSPLFIHQFSHAWIDFRGKREHRPPYVDYFDNSVQATRAQRQFFIDVLSKEFPKYGPN